MDTVLARSVDVRPENKIAMKCPSWPDTPLHQYFGAKKCNQRKSDFAISSLGYVRLYECCCPCERNHVPGQDSESGSSFVHLEERLRGDGPFILYRRPPPRRVGLGLSERAREKRLLKYYKYFQGFQRKFQVSRQFQQAYHKPENKARVKKIINCYKPKRTAEEQSTQKTVKSKQTNPGSSSNSSSRSVDENSHSVDDETYRCVDESAVSEVKNKNVTAANTDKKKKTKVKINKKHASVKKELSEMAAVFSCMDTNMNVFLKKADRNTLKTPTLATIEEVTGDCDVSELEKSSETATTSTPRVSINPDLPKKNQVQEMRTLHTPSTFPNNVPYQLRGILKHHKQISPPASLKEPDALEIIPKQIGKCEITSSRDQQITSQTSQKPKMKKTRRTRKTSVNIPLSGDDLSFAGGLKVTEKASLKKEVLPKARRFRPVLKRTGDTPSQSMSLSSSDKFDQSEAVADASEDFDNVLATPEEKFTFLLERKNSSTPKIIKDKKMWAKTKGKLPPGSIIKFSGWDFGTSIRNHSLGKVPEEKDLCLQQLERAEKLCWGKYPQTMTAEQLAAPSLGKCEAETPDAYLQGKGVAQIFEHLARSLVVKQSDRPFDGLHSLAHNLTTQHSDLQCIERDLEDMKECPKPVACTRYKDTSVNLLLAKLSTKPRQRVGSLFRRIISPMLVGIPDDEVHEQSSTILATDSNRLLMEE